MAYLLSKKGMRFSEKLPCPMGIFKRTVGDSTIVYVSENPKKSIREGPCMVKENPATKQPPPRTSAFVAAKPSTSGGGPG